LTSAPATELVIHMVGVDPRQIGNVTVVHLHASMRPCPCCHATACADRS
jgi:hypothetical protein